MTQTAEKQHRLFFELWPQAAECAALAAWQAPLHGLCGGRAMRPETLHCTLVFLGNVAAHRLEELVLAAREVVMPPFTLELDAARYWRHNHIVYAAPLSPPPELSGMVAKLEGALHKRGFRFDARDHRPHVTLLRHAQWTDASLPAMPSVRWHGREFVLVESVCGEQGARYKVLARFPVNST